MPDTTTTTTRTTIDNPEMEATHYGIPVAHLGDDGDLIALGHHSNRRALAAFNRHARVFVGLANLTDDRSAKVTDFDGSICQMWAVFRKSDPASEWEDPEWDWVADWTNQNHPEAQPITMLVA